VGDGVGLYLICRRFEGGRLRNLACIAQSKGVFLVREPPSSQTATPRGAPGRPIRCLSLSNMVFLRQKTFCRSSLLPFAWPLQGQRGRTRRPWMS
jgi:hypothetical protein